MTTTVPTLPFSARGAVSAGWRSMKAGYGPLLVAVLIFTVIAIFVAAVQNGASSSDIGVGLLVGLALGVFVTTPLAAGVAYMALLSFRGERPRVGQMFTGFSAGGAYGSLVGISLIAAGIELLCLIPAVAAYLLARVATETGAAIGMIGLFATLVLFVAVAVRLMFATVIRLDPRSGADTALESIRASWRLTDSRTLVLVRLGLLVLLVFTGTFLLLCVGAIFLGYPLVFAIYGAAYGLLQDGEEPLRVEQRAPPPSPVAAPEPPRTVVREEPQPPPAPRGLDLRSCPSCGTRVVPKADGSCPHCAASF